MNYFEGVLSDLLKEQFGGEGVYGEDVKHISKLLFTTPENIIFTTSDIDFEEVVALTIHLFQNGVDDFYTVEDNLHVCLKFGFRFIYEYTEGGLSTFFIAKSDKEAFEQLIGSIK